MLNQSNGQFKGCTRGICDKYCSVLKIFDYNRVQEKAELLRNASTLLVFIDVCDICTLIRAHCFRADAVANSFLLAVDLAKGTIQVPLPVDLITVDLNGKYQILLY